MTANVGRAWPALIPFGGLYTGKPFTVGQAGTFVNELAHLHGYQLPMVMCQAFGSAESSSATYHMLYQAPTNSRGLVFVILPMGNTDSGAPYVGTVAVASAETPTPLDVRQRTADVADLGDLLEREIVFSRAISTGLVDVQWTTSDVRPHSIAVFSVPRPILSGSHLHVDRSFADPTRFLTDNQSASNPRGWHAVLQAIKDYRADTGRRHWNWFFNPGYVHTPSAGNTWDDVTPFTNMKLRGRNLAASATTNAMQTEVSIYPTAFATGTWEFRVVGDLETTTNSLAFTGTAEWKGSVNPVAALADGLTFQMRANSVDTVKIQVRRTAGAGTLTINGVAFIENPA